jgi:general secretion pathway protein G
VRQRVNAPLLERIVPTTLWSETFGTRSRWGLRRGMLGIDIDQCEIRAVSVRGGVPEWACLVEVVDGDLAVTLTRLLIWLRVQKRRQPTVRIALGPAFVRMSAHNGVLVHETHRVASAVQVRGNRTWVARFSREALEAIAYASRQTRVTVQAIVPTLDVLGRGLAATYDSVVLWPPDVPKAAIRWTGGVLQSVIAIEDHFAVVRPPGLAPVPALAVLGRGAATFAGAFGVAISDVPLGATGALVPVLSRAARARVFERSRGVAPRLHFAAIRRAFTLIELIVVIAIIATLAAVVAPAVFRNVGDAKVGAAKSQIEVFALALNAYRLDNDNFPTSDQGLEALRTAPTTGDPPRNWRGPYLSRVVPLDPWGRAYIYISPGKANPQSFDLYTLGRDGKPGGDGEDADITSWGGPVQP